MLQRTALGSANDIVPRHDRGTAGGWHQRGQHADQRTLARAVRPEEAEDLAALYGESYIVDGQDRAKPLGDPFHIDRGAVIHGDPIINGDLIGGPALLFHDG